MSALPADFDLVEPVRRAACAIDTITDARQRWHRANRRPRALSARDALIALQFEVLLVRVAAANIRNGVNLSNDDFERLGLACARIEAIAGEVAV